ncbi:hypothetical protein RXV90_22535 [Rhodophyticola sp. MJ-SS7]|nr:hypothetical protein [Rhodophyticola sp. MJ-SS7]
MHSHVPYGTFPTPLSSESLYKIDVIMISRMTPKDVQRDSPGKATEPHYFQLDGKAFRIVEAEDPEFFGLEQDRTSPSTLSAVPHSMNALIESYRSNGPLCRTKMESRFSDRQP